MILDAVIALLLKWISFAQAVSWSPTRDEFILISGHSNLPDPVPLRIAAEFDGHYFAITLPFDIPRISACESYPLLVGRQAGHNCPLSSESGGLSPHILKIIIIQSPLFIVGLPIDQPDNEWNDRGFLNRLNCLWNLMIFAFEEPEV